jgi:predicted RecB family nuclease
MTINSDLFRNFVACNYKAFLKHTRVVVEPTETESLHTELDAKFRQAAIERLLQENQGERISRAPTSLVQGVHGGNQALAVRDKKVYAVRTPELPAQATRVYLDVEGIPDRDFYYLVGVIVERDGECTAHSFWADDQAGEPGIWFDLLALLRGLDEYTRFHYGSYEKSYVTTMLKKYPSPDATDEPSLPLVNVPGLIRTSDYFPAYSNGLKDIASSVGATWEGRISSGIECIARRLRWEESREEVVKGEIMNCNRDDCLALDSCSRARPILRSSGSSSTEKESSRCG